MPGSFFEFLGWIGFWLFDWIPHDARPFPKIRPVIGRVVGVTFALTLLFTWPGVILLSYIIPLSETLALQLVLTAWALFLLFFAATMLWLVVRGTFF